MEIAAYTAGIAAVVIFGVAALLGVLHLRDASIWTTWGACVLTLTGGFCWLQDREWKKDSATHTPKERAMVVPIAFSGEPKVNESFTAFVRYKNTGKVIAKDVRVVFVAYPIKKGEKPDFNIIENEPSTGGSVFFLTPGEESTSYHPQAKTKPLTELDIAQIESGDVVIYAFGKIYYRDTPECSHWTKFCTYYIPSVKRYSNYSDYNDTDEVKCP